MLSGFIPRHPCLSWGALGAVLSIVSAAAGAEPVQFQRFTEADGLSQNTVICMLHDRRGFMWFGTMDGLSRFDGQSFTRRVKKLMRLNFFATKPSSAGTTPTRSSALNSVMCSRTSARRFQKR